MSALEEYKKRMASKNKKEEDMPKENKKKATTKKSAKATKATKVTKATKPTKEETIAKEVKKNPQASTSSLVDKLKGQLSTMQGSGEFTGPRFNFVKLEEGKNYFRIVEPTSGPLAIICKRQKGKWNGKFRSVIDLRWLINDDEALEAMMERNKITDNDVKLINKYGEPYDLLFRALKDAGRTEAFSAANIGQKKAMFVVYHEEDFGILEMGLGFADTFAELLSIDEDMVSLDNGVTLLVTKTKKGKSWRDVSYVGPIPTPERGPIEVELGENEELTTPNLYDVLAINTLGYRDKVQFLFSSHSKLADMAALEPSDFGLGSRDISTSFDYGENKKKRKAKKVNRVYGGDEDEYEDEEEELEEDEFEEEGDEDEEEDEEEELEEYDEDEDDDED